MSATHGGRERWGTRLGLVLAMAGNALAAMILHPLGSLILTYDNLVGSRHLSVSMSSNTYTLILTGGLLIVIGWVMREAARISDENRQFV